MHSSQKSLSNQALSIGQHNEFALPAEMDTKYVWGNLFFHVKFQIAWITLKMTEFHQLRFTLIWLM